jgi:hypothetical protein
MEGQRAPQAKKSGRHDAARQPDVASGELMLEATQPGEPLRGFAFLIGRTQEGFSPEGRAALDKLAVQVV